ncbi:sugar-binding domain-containing protein [uncultured Parabacteroides sp.]|uniref:sugar-binding domain-containing protein n=1 Tax=uncultured Parabacteroides sp. TaxID=512312 RepID=UPI0025DA744D|nr:sugar-binding domain-containing protein [uncultured Parabacteroides sp.]
MKQVNILLFWASISLVLFLSCKGASSELSLAGEWQFALDPKDAGVGQQWQNKELGDVVRLPGSLQEQGKGEDVSLDTRWTGQVVDSSWYSAPEYAAYRQPGNIKVPFWLNPDKHYVGVAWYQKKVNVPAGWEDRPVVLSLERTHWATTLYVDGEKAGEQNSLQTPHRYVLEGLTAGEHTITLRVDNRLYVDVGMNAHSVSDHTQSNWNGIIGDIKLSAKPSLYIGSVQIYPDIKTRQARVKVRFEGSAGQASSTVTLQAETLAGKPVGEPVQSTFNGTSGHVEATVDLGEDAALWSEHTPNVYKMKVSLQSPGGIDEASYNFGLREFKANGTRFEVNGQPVFLRGTLECCIFPLTGYPAMHSDYWAKIYRTCKAYGLNHVRFHSWCPPEAAFHVADSMGVYLQVECGGWAEVGSGKPQDQWLKEESDRILEEYGNHPSFCMMVYGNEPGGADQVRYLSGLVDLWKSKDGRHVYSSAAGWPYVENADYWNTPDPRIQAWGAGLNSIINREAPRTDYDFAAKLRPDMPTVSHEIGQWCVYPNFDEIKKYTGVLKAKNLEIFRETLAAKGMADMGAKFLYASGRLQTLCYKADIEAALRTPGFAGFQLLDLHDFPGQGTALVGVLDPFWDDKGYVTGEEYSTFCNSTVPLVRFPKMVWLNDEVLEAPLEMAHFGEKAITHATVNWRITAADKQVLAEGAFTRDLPLGNCIPAGNIHCDLSGIKEASQLTVTASIEGTDIQNRWNIWVYPAVKQAVSTLPHITTRLDRTAQEKLQNGESVLLLTYGTVPPDKGGDIVTGFSSIFWNTAWTRGQAPHTLGICCDAGHPALAAFPNDGVSDYQWWDLMSRCDAMVMDGMPEDFRPIVYIVDDWFTNRKLGMLYEARVGKGKLLVCGADLQNDLATRPAAAQFRQSLLEYMASLDFNPSQELKVEDIVHADLR